MLIKGAIGAGKTKFLQQKYLELIKTGAKISEILVLCHSSFLRDKWLKKLKLEGISGETPHVQTFNGVVYNAIVGTGYVGKVSYTIKIKKNICGLAKSKYICGGNYHAMAVNQYDRSYDNMFILYNNEEGRYIIFS